MRNIKLCRNKEKRNNRKIKSKMYIQCYGGIKKVEWRNVI